MIGGNLEAILQIGVPTQNDIGEDVVEWHDVTSFLGFLDLQTGDSKSITYYSKIEESTHIFICDYKPIPAILEIGGRNIPFSTENARMVANSKRYDVLFIDNPMELNQHYEISLKYTGGQ